MATSVEAERDELLTRWSLIRRVSQAECDEVSWTEFYGIYRKLIYAVARKCELRREEAEDVVQETMRSVCENFPDFVPDPARGSFKSWLLQMARWRITDQLRKRSKYVPVPTETLTSDESRRTGTLERVPDPASLKLDSVWEEEWRKGLFHLAVEKIKDRVSPDQFQVFDFLVLRQMPVKKVARSLDINVGQVYLARHRVLKLIKQEVKVLENKIR